MRISPQNAGPVSRLEKATSALSPAHSSSYHLTLDGKEPLGSTSTREMAVPLGLETLSIAEAAMTNAASSTSYHLTGETEALTSPGRAEATSSASTSG